MILQSGSSNFKSNNIGYFYFLGEYLEWIVIILIAAEILVAAINIVVDLYAGVD